MRKKGTNGLVPSSYNLVWHSACLWNVDNFYCPGRSPLFSQVSITLKGLYTIRSLGIGEQLMKKFHSIQDAHSSASFLFVSVFRWLGLRIDLTVAVFYMLVLVATMLLPANGKLTLHCTLGLTEFIECIPNWIKISPRFLLWSISEVKLDVSWVLSVLIAWPIMSSQIRNVICFSSIVAFEFVQMSVLQEVILFLMMLNLWCFGVSLLSLA